MRLVVENRGLALSIASKWYSRLRVSYDDAVSVAYWGLIRASAAYDPAQGAFAPLAGKCIRRELFRFARKERMRGMGGIPDFAPVTSSLDEPVHEDGSTRHELLGAPSISPEEMLFAAEVIDYAETHLDRIERDTLRAALEDDVKSDVHTRHKTSRQWVYFKRRSMREKLARRFRSAR